MQAIKNELNALEYHSKECEIHHEPLIVPLGGRGDPFCGSCFKEKQNKQLEDQQIENWKGVETRKRFRTLTKYSLLTDSTIEGSRISQYEVSIGEQERNIKTVKEAVKRLYKGEVFNVILQGRPGTGKTHLAYAMLQTLNESFQGKQSCLFISFEDALRKIRGSFSNKDSKYTEDYLVQLMTDADVLVIDDLGSETGHIETGKSATDFVHRVLFAVANARQHKPTIYTFNLSGASLVEMYDEKLVSRIMRNSKQIVFEETPDYRVIKEPF